MNDIVDSGGEIEALRRKLAEAEEALQISAIHREQWRHREGERNRQLAEAREQRAECERALGAKLADAVADAVASRQEAAELRQQVLVLEARLSDALAAIDIHSAQARASGEEVSLFRGEIKQLAAAHEAASTWHAEFQAQVQAQVETLQAERMALAATLSCAEERLRWFEQENARVLAQAADEQVTARAELATEIERRQAAEAAAQRSADEVTGLRQDIAQLQEARRRDADAHAVLIAGLAEAQAEQAKQRSSSLSLVSSLVNGDLAERAVASAKLRPETLAVVPEVVHNPDPAKSSEQLVALMGAWPEPFVAAPLPEPVLVPETVDEQAGHEPAPVVAEIPEAEPEGGAIVDLNGLTAQELLALDHVRTLFHEEFYLRQYPDVAASGVPAFDHFVNAGRFEGRAPHPLFCMETYRRHFPADGAPVDLYSHYLVEGGRNGFNPCPEFDAEFYCSQVGDGHLDGLPPLIHYLTIGAALGLAPSPRFNAARYVENRPDIDFKASTPLEHYCMALRDPKQAAGMGPIWTIEQFEAARPLLEKMHALHIKAL